MFTLEKQSKVNVKESEAKQLLAMNTYENQRKIRRATVGILQDELTAGRLRPLEISLARVQGGSYCLVNGQHQLTVALEHKAGLPATVSYYRCDTPADMVHLFATFDTTPRRSGADCIRGYRGLLAAELVDLPIRMLTACSSALAILEDGGPKFYSRPISTAHKAGLLTIYLDDLTFIYSLWNERSEALIRRVPVMLSILAISRKNGDNCYPFLEQVVNGIGLQLDTPQYKLHEFLTLKYPSGTGWPCFQSVYMNIISWWNTFCTGIFRQSVKAASMKTLPTILIYGEKAGKGPPKLKLTAK